MFSILIEAWYKGTVLYADYGLDAYFFEVFAIHKSFGKISTQNMLFSIFI